MNTVHVRWLRLAWALAAFVPARSHPDAGPRAPDATPGFRFGARSGDGDHYLLIDERTAGTVYFESDF